MTLPCGVGARNLRGGVRGLPITSLADHVVVRQTTDEHTGPLNEYVVDFGEASVRIVLTTMALTCPTDMPSHNGSSDILRAGLGAN